MKRLISFLIPLMMAGVIHAASTLYVGNFSGNAYGLTNSQGQLVTNAIQGIIATGAGVSSATTNNSVVTLTISGGGSSISNLTESGYSDIIRNLVVSTNFWANLSLATNYQGNAAGSTNFYGSIGIGSLAPPLQLLSTNYIGSQTNSLGQVIANALQGLYVTTGATAVTNSNVITLTLAGPLQFISTNNIGAVTNLVGQYLSNAIQGFFVTQGISATTNNNVITVNLASPLQQLSTNYVATSVTNSFGQQEYMSPKG